MLLNYSDDGPGPVVVLLHGFPLDLSIWEAQRGTLGSMYRVIAPDLRGHGRTAAPEGVYTMDDLADDVIEVLDALEIGEPVIVGGLSMGGYVALSMALRHPSRLRGLMLMDTRARADAADAAVIREDLADEVARTGNVEPVVASMLPKLFSDITRARRPELIAEVHEVMSRTSPLGVIGALRGMAIRPDRTGDLARIAIPTLVMTGTDDALIAVDESKAMAEAIPNAEFVAIPDAGHLAPLENPVAANAAILRFLGSLA